MKRLIAKAAAVFGTFGIAAALLAAGPAPAQAAETQAGWNADHSVYTVIGQEGYPQSYSDVITLEDGETLDLTQADAINGGYIDDDDYYAFEIDGDNVTIKGDPDKVYNFCFYVYSATGYSGADGKARTLNLVDFRCDTSSHDSYYGCDVFKANVEITYDGICELPGIEAWREGEYTYTFKAADAAAKLTLDRIYSLYDSYANLVFDGGQVVAERGVEGGSLTIKNGCHFDGYLRSHSAGDNLTESILGADQITIEDSFVTATMSEESIEGCSGSYGQQAIIGGEAGNKYLLEEGTFVKIVNSAVTVDNTVGKTLCGIGCVETIDIDKSTVTVEGPDAITSKSRSWEFLTGIGGVFSSIAITDSTVTASGREGAGIGWGERFTDDGGYDKDYPYDEASTSSITIEDSSVTATSVTGAGIGACYPQEDYSAGRDSAALVPAVNISIAGEESEVCAYSVNGAAIGGGANEPTVDLPLNGEPLIIGGSTIAGWQILIDGGETGGDAELQSASAAARNASLLSTVAPASMRAVSGNVSTEDLPEAVSEYVYTNKGTLTVDDKASVVAESGVYAIAMGKVETGQTIVQNTVKSEPSDTIEIMVGAADEAGTTQKLGELRTDFKSIASTMGTLSGDMHLYYGDGDGALAMVDWNGTDPTYGDTFAVAGNAFSSFFAMPPFELNGELAVSGSQKVNEPLSASTDALAPEKATYELQWYCNGSTVEGMTSDVCTPASEGVYYVVATGTGQYTGSVTSNAVTVSENAGEVGAPEIASVTSTTVTVKEPGSGSYEYSIDYGDIWQPGLTFAGLNPDTTYYVMRKATDGALQGAWSNPVSVTTKCETPTAENISIDYLKETVAFSQGVDVCTDAACTEESKILRGSVISEYIGKQLYVRYKGVTGIGVDDVWAFTVPARPEAPSVTVTERTDTTITIETEAGVDYNYAVGDGVPENATAFAGTGEPVTISGLLPNTEYTIHARKPATDMSFHSVQITEKATTKDSGPAAPKVSGSVAVSETDDTKLSYTVSAESSVAGAVYEYRMDGGEWQESAVFDGIEPESTHAFEARIAGTDDAMPGAAGSTGSVTFAKVEGAASVTIEGWTYGDAASVPVPESATNGVGNVTYQYKVQGADDSTYASEQPTDAGAYTVRATFAATAVYAQVSATCDFEVEKAELTVKADDQSVAYGDEPPTLTVRYDEFKGDDTAATALTGTPAVSCDYRQGDPVDEGPFGIRIDLAGVTSDNYELLPQNGTLAVEPRTVAISWTDPEGGHVVGDGKGVACAIENIYEDEGGKDDVSLVVEGADADTAGSHTAKATGLAGADAANYRLPTEGEAGYDSLAHVYVVAQSGVEFVDGMTVQNGDGQETSAFTYGETMVVTVAPEASGEAAADALVEPAGGQMALYYRPADGSEDVQLTEPVDVQDDGTYRMEYATTAKLVPCDEVVLVAAYIGTDDIASDEIAAKVTLAPKSLTVSFSGATAKTYDGTTAAPQGLAIELGGVEEVDAGSVSVTAASIAYDSSDAGKATTITVRGLALAGDATTCGFYTLSATALSTGGSIAARSIADAAVTLGPSLTYTGSEQTQSVAAIDADGIALDLAKDCVISGATATDAGTYVLVIRGTGNFTGTIEVPYAVAKADGSVQVSPVQGVTEGDGPFSLDVDVIGDGELSYASSDESVLKVDAQGTVTVVGAGTATITVTLADGANYTGASGSIDVHVAAASQKPGEDDDGNGGDGDDDSADDDGNTGEGGNDGNAGTNGGSGVGTCGGNAGTAGCKDALAQTGDIPIAPIALIGIVAAALIAAGAIARRRVAR